MRSKQFSLNHAQGFSLLEILLVMVIIGILSSLLAYPTFKAHLIKARRTYATCLLLDVAAQLEEFYLINNTYDGATLTKLKINNNDYKKYYQLTIITENNKYILRADPISNQAKNDNICQSFTLDSLGNKAITGSGALDECWP
jgi:type IV pilus assembly protein PilE